MNRSTAINAADAISTYILAKDSNRPQLMKHAFAGDCELEMAVKTDAISFPNSAKGLEQITQNWLQISETSMRMSVHFASRVPIQSTYRISVAIGWSGCRQGKAAQFALDADITVGISVPTPTGA